MKTINLIQNRILVSFILGIAGIVLYPNVLVHDKYDRRTVNHELIHVYQIRQERYWGVWYLKYFYYLFKYGYRNNPYKVEAFEHQRFYLYLSERDPELYLQFRKYLYKPKKHEA